MKLDRNGYRSLVAGAWLLLGAGCGHPKVCDDGQVAVQARAQRDPKVGYHTRAHAHNDYEHARPLLDALDQRFYSVEADIYYYGGSLGVSHDPLGSKGTLKDLYLDPLQARVTEKGSVYGDGVPFVLWIDLKEGSVELVTALHTLLDGYPMLTRYTDAGITPGPVTVLLTGDARGKEDFTARFPDRRAARDSNNFSPSDPTADNAWRAYALDWAAYLSSSSNGTLSSAERARLACIVDNAHDAGRQVRFYNMPGHAEAWGEALNVGVDFISADDLAGLNSFLESEP